MNKIKRKELSKIGDRLSSARDIIDYIKGDLEYILTEEEDTLNNMERFSGTDRYAAMEEAIDNMSDAVSTLEDAIDNIDNAIESIYNSQN